MEAIRCLETLAPIHQYTCTLRRIPEDQKCYFNKCLTICDHTRFYYICKLLYMFRVDSPPIIRSLNPPRYRPVATTVDQYQML